MGSTQVLVKESDKMILSLPLVIATTVPILVLMLGSHFMSAMRSSLLSLAGDNPARLTDNRGDVLIVPDSEQNYQKFYPNDQSNYYQQFQQQHNFGQAQGRQFEGLELSSILPFLSIPTILLVGTLFLPRYNLLNAITRSGLALDDRELEAENILSFLENLLPDDKNHQERN